MRMLKLYRCLKLILYIKILIFFRDNNYATIKPRGLPEPRIALSLIIQA